MQGFSQFFHLSAHQVQTVTGRLRHQRIDLVEFQNRGDQTLAGLIVQVMRQAQALVLFSQSEVPAQAEHQVRLFLALDRQMRVGPG